MTNRIFLTFLSVIVIGSATHAAAQSIASVYSLEGSAQLRTSGGANWQTVTASSTFNSGDTLRTSAGCRMGVLFKDGALVRLAEKSELTFQGGDKAGVDLAQGRGYFFSREANAHPRVNTPVVSGSIRGTEFAVEVTPKETTFSVINGSVALSNKYGEVILGSGEQGFASAGKAPQSRLLVNPTDAVQWAIYFPAGLFDGAPSAEAREAVLAILKNDKQRAQDLVNQALAKDSGALAALLAASYVAQASFEPAEARRYAAQAVERYPTSSAALLRLAELELGLGATEAARELTARALKSSPGDAHARTLMGFVALVDNRAADARRDFESAVASEPGAGLQRLGLGLARIKLGELEPGRQEIEKAVHLEPTVSAYRSYLGKAFYEEERWDTSRTELSEAIRLDPLDPTPYLYRSYLNLAQYKPIEALWDLEDSISRNDNRAVYRSSLLLDQDSATRSAGLARTFSALGFAELARVEAIRSLQRDYSNYSAHYLLANSYQNSGPAFLNGSITQNLTASLLSPVNFNAILPSTGGAASLNDYTALYDRPTTRSGIAGFLDSFDDRVETEVRTLGSTERASYFLRYENVYSDGYRDNDYMRRHVVRGFSHLALSPNDTLLLDASFAALDQGDTYQDIDPNLNDPDSSLEIDDFTARLGYHHQFAANSHTIAQLLAIDFGLDGRNDSLESPLFVDLLEDGELVESLESLATLRQRDSRDSRGVRFDAAHIYDSEIVSLVGGVGVFSVNAESNEDSTVLEEELGIFTDTELPSSGDVDERSQTGYLYSTWHLAEWLDLNAALSYSHVEFDVTQVAPYIDETDSRSRVNPKVGLTIYPDSNTTLRAAYFETLGNSSLRDLERLEPVTIGGFNQLFEELPGDRSRNLAFGVDYKLPKLAYLGAEAQHRKVISDANFTTPLISLDLVTSDQSNDLFLEEYDQHYSEDSVKAYWYQIIGSRWVSSTIYEWYDLEDDFYAYETRTHKVALGGTYFDPSGIILFANATWRGQERDDLPEATNGENSHFWLVDCGVGYQLPNRHGVIKLAVENIFDEDYAYLPSSREGVLYPGRGVTLNYNVNF